MVQKQSATEVIIVDYGCLQGTAPWVKSNYPDFRTVVVSDDSGWSASRARNLGALRATGHSLLFLDADVRLRGDLGKWISKNAENGKFYRCINGKELVGSILCDKEVFDRIGGYDEAFRGWGGEDIDFYKRLKHIGIRQGLFPSDLFESISHGDELRTFANNDSSQSKQKAREVYKTYITEKFDYLYANGEYPPLETRTLMMKEIKSKVYKVDS